MTPEEVVARARSCLGQGCRYTSGAGGMDPASEFPWNQHRQLDCSGFAMWCVGLSRKQGAIWYDTTRIRLDAIDGGTLFEALPLESGLPGDLIVYGDRHIEGITRQGHVGIISSAGVLGHPALVIHCSLSNWTGHGDAIRETGPAAWLAHPETVIARCTALERIPA